MKIDLHVHINRTSRCARQEPEEAATKAKSLGIDGIVILDHHYYPTQEECHKTEQETGVKIFKGIEITVKADGSDAISGTRGGANDLVIISNQSPQCETGQYHRPITTSELPVLLEHVAKTNGLSILAHPYRRDKPLVIDLGKYHIDCVEIASRNTAVHNRDKILETAERYGMVCVADSDAHKTRHLGCFCIETDEPVNDESELAHIVKAKKFSLLETRLASFRCLPRNFAGI